MLRSAATPYPERHNRMKENQLETSHRIPLVCGPKKVRAIRGSYIEL